MFKDTISRDEHFFKICELEKRLGANMKNQEEMFRQQNGELEAKLIKAEDTISMQRLTIDRMSETIYELMKKLVQEV